MRVAHDVERQRERDQPMMVWTGAAVGLGCHRCTNPVGHCSLAPKMVAGRHKQTGTPDLHVRHAEFGVILTLRRSDGRLLP